MKSLSLKIEDSIINETDELIKDIKISRNQYIIQAIAFYNKIKKRKLLEARMKRAVNAVGNSSLEVLHEFEINQIDRLIKYLRAVDSPHSGALSKPILQRDFNNFYEQYDQRRGKDFRYTFPQLAEWYDAL